MDTCEAAPVSAQEIRIQCLGTPEIDSPLSSNMATGGERRVVFNVDEELLDTIQMIAAFMGGMKED